ncbi:MAG: hypothetical protein SX243_18205 [Acidobacteriota bacterium]|nr:hypothetical protein [Acidobacteriota bacterium]
MPGRSRRSTLKTDLLAALLAAVLTAAVAASFAWSTGIELWHNDGLDYAQIGREFASGNGLASRQAIYALHLRFLGEHDLLDQPWPNLHRFPLPALTLGLFFLLFGATSGVVVAHGITALAATSGVLHLWARRALGPWPAVAASALVAFNGELFYNVQAGMPEAWVALWVTLALYWLWRPGGPLAPPSSDPVASVDSRKLLRGALAGAALGLAVLSRTNAVTVVPVLLLALIPWKQVPWRRMRWKELRQGLRDDPATRRLLRQRAALGGLLLGGLLLVMAPWMVRNLALTGKPTFSLHTYYLVPSGAVKGETKKDYSLRWVRDFVPPLEYARAHPRALIDKWVHNGEKALRGYPTFGATFLLAFLPWLAFRRRWGGPLQRTAVVVCGAFVANALLCNLTDVNPPRYYYHLLPAMMLVAVAVVQRWTGTARDKSSSRGWGLSLRGVVAAGLLVVLANPPALAASLQKVARKGEVRLDLEQMAALEAATDPDAVIFSDRSAQVTWYTGRRSVRFHHTRDSKGRRVAAVLELDRDLVPIDAIYLSGPFLDHPKRGKLWTRLQKRPEFRRLFECQEPFGDGAVICRRRG